MDVLTLLKTDHKTVAGMFDEAMKCKPGDRRLREIAVAIEGALTVHAAIEEKFFYPQLRDRAEEQEERVDVFEAYTEHDVLKYLIKLLKTNREPDEVFKAELQVLGENVKHHVKEEESTIFSLARELMDKDELDELGVEMEQAKTRLGGKPTKKPPARKAAAKKSPAKKSPAKKTAKKRR